MSVLKTKIGTLEQSGILLLVVINLVWLFVMVYTSSTIAIHTSSQNVELDYIGLESYIFHFIKMFAIMLVFNIIVIFAFSKIRRKIA